MIDIAEGQRVRFLDGFGFGTVLFRDGYSLAIELDNGRKVIDAVYSVEVVND